MFAPRHGRPVLLHRAVHRARAFAVGPRCRPDVRLDSGNLHRPEVVRGVHASELDRSLLPVALGGLVGLARVLAGEPHLVVHHVPVGGGMIEGMIAE